MDFGSALGGAFGGVASGVLGLIGANQQNQNAQAMMQQQENYETQMSNTAHQRDVADLKAAGLNPILSANAGSSTPSIQQAPVVNALGQGVTSAVDTMKLANDMRATNSTIALQQAQGAAATASASRDQAVAKKTGVDTTALQSQLNAIKSSADTLNQQNQYTQKYMKFDNIGKRIQSGLNMGNSAKDLLNPVKGLIGAPEPAVPPYQGNQMGIGAP